MICIYFPHSPGQRVELLLVSWQELEAEPQLHINSYSTDQRSIRWNLQSQGNEENKNAFKKRKENEKEKKKRKWRFEFFSAWSLKHESGSNVKQGNVCKSQWSGDQPIKKRKNQLIIILMMTMRMMMWAGMRSQPPLWSSDNGRGDESGSGASRPSARGRWRWSGAISECLPCQDAADRGRSSEVIPRPHPPVCER